MQLQATVYELLADMRDARISMKKDYTNGGVFGQHLDCEIEALETAMLNLPIESADRVLVYGDLNKRSEA